MYMQNPTAVGKSITSFIPILENKASSVLVVSPSGRSFDFTKTGKLQISALLQYGVTVPIAGSLYAHSLIRSNQSLATSVSLFNNTTSAEPASRMPRLTVPTKPLFVELTRY